MESTQLRKPWSYYERPDQQPNAAITQRDLDILRELYEHRFANSRQLCALFGDAVDRRLRTLWKAGYIDRPRATRFWRMREGGGSQPGIYALTNRGAQALVAFGVIDKNTRDFDELNRRLSGLSSKIPHDLAVGDVRVAFKRTAAGDRPFHLAPSKALSIPGRDEPLYPDLPFFSGHDLFFTELHTGSEPESRYSSPDLSNLKGKFEGYQAYALAKRCRAQFGVSGFRVLTVVTGGKIMLENVCETARSVVGDQGVNRFLAIRLAELLDANPYAVPWRNAKEEPVFL